MRLTRTIALSLFVLTGATVGAGSSWAQSACVSMPTAATDKASTNACANNQNFYGSCYDPWAHSKGSH